MQTITYLANAQATAQKAGLFESLGIDVKMLVLQSIAFLALLWLLNKYVYPVLTRMLDEREAKIEEGQKAANEALKKADKAGADIEKQLAVARKTAEDIVATAQHEAAKRVEEAEAKAGKKAEHVLEQARARIDSDIADAKKDLHSEMVGLVAKATEKVLQQKLDAKADAALIKKALEEAK